jgi:hypothetical protein
MRKKNVDMYKKSYILKILLNIVAAEIEAFVVSGYKFFVPMSKKSAACKLSQVLYCETLKKLRRAIQNKRRGILTSGTVLLHDNVHSHTAART